MGSLLWNRPAIACVLFLILHPLNAQHLAAYHNNQGRFFIFDNGKTIEAEYLPVSKFKVGGNCILYVDHKDNLKMYANGVISTLEVSAPGKFEALNYLAVYSLGGIVKILDRGRTITISTNSVNYSAEDSLVSFYDTSRQLLAVYYRGKVHLLEDGLTGNSVSQFKAGGNLVAYISYANKDFKIFYQGKNQTIEPFLLGGSFKTGTDIVAFVNQADSRLKVFYRGQVSEIEDFPPQSWQTGDGILAYVDQSGSFKAFIWGEVVDIASFKPDFYKVIHHMIVYGEKSYFKVWYNNRSYLLETYTPVEWQSDWNTIIYRDLNKHVKVFTQGESRVLTYDLAEDISLYRDVVVVNKGMNNHNVYDQGKKY